VNSASRGSVSPNARNGAQADPLRDGGSTALYRSALPLYGHGDVRQRKRQNGITINAVAGTRVVFLGLDLVEDKHKHCLGFAIQRHDPDRDETVFLRGKKTFAATDPGVGPGGYVSTWDHPVQGFWWADYDALPGRTYTYKVTPRYGKPEKLTSGRAASVTVNTEPERGRKHSVYFNRGAVASQDYARDFGKNPEHLTGEVQDAAYTYLSHGLREGLVAFLERATGPEWSLHGAVYEFNWHEILDALAAAAHARKAKVQIVYDAIPGDGHPVKHSEVAIGKAGIGDLCIPRSIGKIMHNKFFVLSKAGEPVAVWTGSTNISENGIFGHLNVGHAVDDKKVAADYLRYWKQLKKNPDRETQQKWVEKNNPVLKPEQPWTAPISTVFSPHKHDEILARYVALAGSAGEALCMTFAFGMDDDFKTVYERTDDVLRLALLEDYGVGANKEKQKEVITHQIQPRKNVVISVGGSIPTNGFDTWVKESTGLTQNVQWVHTKFMLVDPLSDDPTIVTGSANFSDESTHLNDENMLVIRGDLRVADIYFSEYMRLFAHYAFREAVLLAMAKNEDWHPSRLKDHWEEWLPQYFTPGDPEIRRRYFATGTVH
jgi:PLD-like domain